MSQEISIELPDDFQLNKQLLQKMIFITNALEQGWTVKKNEDSYIFSKKHENKREIFQEDYLETFVTSNFSTNVLFSEFEKSTKI
jgi:hypothetical protein